MIELEIMAAARSETPVLSHAEANSLNLMRFVFFDFNVDKDFRLIGSGNSSSSVVMDSESEFDNIMYSEPEPDLEVDGPLLSKIWIILFSFSMFLFVVIRSTVPIHIFLVVRWSTKNFCSRFGTFLSLGQLHFLNELHLQLEISNKFEAA